MPYGSDGERPDENPLSEAERKHRVKDMQREQAETLREKLGDELYDWPDSFESDFDSLGED